MPYLGLILFYLKKLLKLFKIFRFLHHRFVIEQELDLPSMLLVKQLADESYFLGAFHNLAFLVVLDIRYVELGNLEHL